MTKKNLLWVLLLALASKVETPLSAPAAKKTTAKTGAKPAAKKKAPAKGAKSADKKKTSANEAKTADKKAPAKNTKSSGQKAPTKSAKPAAGKKEPAKGAKQPAAKKTSAKNAKPAAGKKAPANGGSTNASCDFNQLANDSIKDFNDLKILIADTKKSLNQQMTNIDKLELELNNMQPDLGSAEYNDAQTKIAEKKVVVFGEFQSIFESHKSNLNQCIDNLTKISSKCAPANKKKVTSTIKSAKSELKNIDSVLKKGANGFASKKTKGSKKAKSSKGTKDTKNTKIKPSKMSASSSKTAKAGSKK